ncbi:hypothetical protein HYH03_011002 [Edaphochlamys debaryana]|uniref:Uncharacterized protein n=1 Tax=Edaphochlamys debaryana TaxID=47281 RepID=A0A835Y130_9CHLO|nr:hypothetical protein HYH03_011002 [Edaphochlamys debaryana]|eukprot:KAG2490610.1 hypothetical protein HYH03_011002 [Edaphochlamys debaryana]
MIDLTALQAQLKLLGHNLPEDQVMSILKEMGIDFSDLDGPPDPRPSGAARAGSSASTEGKRAERAGGYAKTGSILDNIDRKLEGTATDGDGGSPEALTGSMALPPGFMFGYTAPGAGAVLGVSRPGLQTTILEGGLSDEEDEEEDAEAREEPAAVHSRYGYTAGRPGAYVAAAAGPSVQASGSHPAWAVRTGTAPGSQGAASSSGTGAGMPPSSGVGGLAESMRRMSVLDSASLGNPPPKVISAHGAGAASSSMAGGMRPQSAGGPRPGSAMAKSRDQLHKGADTRPGTAALSRYHQSMSTMLETSADDDCDVSVADPDRGPGGLSASHHDLAWLKQRAMGQAAGKQGPLGKAAVGSSAAPLARGAGRDQAGKHTADWLGIRGGDYGVTDHEPLSPQASTRSFVSRASTTTRGKVGPPKVDRVKRYQQLAQEWDKSRFLKQGAGTKGTQRKPVNFHSHFASLHATEEAERARLLKETRARTKKELGEATEAPTANRRDELRWQMRMRLREQS